MLIKGIFKGGLILFYSLQKKKKKKKKREGVYVN
jgi:hypothetical protein